MRLAFRQLLKTPGFTSVAIVTLALGIGANTGMFSFLHALLTRPLPLPQVHELVFMGEHSEQVPRMSVAWPNFLDWRERQQSFSAIGVFRSYNFNYIGAAETERISGAQSTHDWLQALGVRPVAGRWFSADEDRPGATPTALVSEAFAKRTFGSVDQALDQQLNLSGTIHTVIGVMPSTFVLPNRSATVWTPFGLVSDDHLNRVNHPGLYAIGRLKPGVTLEAARADLAGIARQLAQEYPESNTGNSINMQTLVDFAVGKERGGGFVIFAAAFGVLLIGCVNVANLLLVRSTARAREFAVRAAVGATRAQLVRLVLTENLLLGLGGTLLGLLVGVWTIEGIKALVPDDTPFLDAVTMNVPVLAFAAATGLGVTLLFGLVPALAGSKVNLSGALAAGGRSGGGMVHARWRAAFVVGEFAVTLVLLFVTGLTIRTIHNVYRADLGLQVDRVISFGYYMPDGNWSDPIKRAQLLERALERLRQLPGVTHAALTNPLPLSGGGNQVTFLPEGMPDPGPGKRFSTENNAASAAYFETMRIPLVRGRTFSDQEKAGDPRVCIVDTQFAAIHFTGEDPIGQRVMIGGVQGTPFTIIGVVGHVENYGVGEDTRVQLYFPYRQAPPAMVSFVLRTSLETAALAPAIRAAMREVEPTLPVFSIRAMDEIFAQTVAPARTMLMLLSTFAGLALLLAAIGLYGVLSYIVGQRTREVGIRMALGATTGMVRSLMLVEGVRLASFGLAIGLLGSLAIARLLESLLYGVSPFDPLSLAAVSLLLVVVGLIASWLPARQATRVAPVEALRGD